MLEILQKLCDVYLFAHLCLVSTSGESNSIRLYKLGLQKFEESQNFEFWERGRKLRKPLDIYIIITFIIISVIIITTPSASSLSNLWMWPGHIPDDHTATDALAKPEINEYLSNVVGIIANILLLWWEHLQMLLQLRCLWVLIWRITNIQLCGTENLPHKIYLLF